MTLRGAGTAVLLVGSLALGIAAGETFYRLMLGTVPPDAMGDLKRGAAHAAFLFYGVIAGGVVFAWTLLAASLARVLGKRKPPLQSDPGSRASSAPLR